MNQNTWRNSLRGKQNRAAGEHFENLIAASLVWYERKGIACIEKTPEPMKPISKPDPQGRFRACYEKRAQPDFKGTLYGGRAVVFEAKHTVADQIEYSRVTDEQRERLDLHQKMGAYAFVLVGLGWEDFYRVPWTVWSDMKEIYGRKHIKQAELEPYRVQYIAGVLKMLEDIEL